MMRVAWHGLGCIAVGAVLCRCSTVPSDALPPPEMEAGAPTTTTISTFAIDSLAIGDHGTWRALGYDLDGKTTDQESTDVCTLAPDTPALDQIDGHEGRDDSFAKNIVPIVETAGGIVDLAQTETLAVQKGVFTLQIQVVGLSDDSDQTADGLVAQVFASDVSDALPPRFDSTTDWPVLPESLIDSSTIQGGALAHFTAAYVTHGTFVAGTNEDVTIPFHVNIDGFVFTLPIHEAIITFDHVALNAAFNGELAGVINPSELIAIFRRFGGRVSASLCGSAFDGIASQLAQAADILSDRSNHAGTPCTAISFGMGFHARRIANPTKVAAPLDYPDPCDAGTDAGTD